MPLLDPLVCWLNPHTIDVYLTFLLSWLLARLLARLLADDDLLAESRRNSTGESCMTFGEENKSNLHACQLRLARSDEEKNTSVFRSMRNARLVGWHQREESQAAG